MHLKAREPQEQDIADGIVSLAGYLNASDGKKPMGLIRPEPAMNRILMDIVNHRSQLSLSPETRFIEVIFEERMFLKNARTRVF